MADQDKKRHQLTEKQYLQVQVVPMLLFSEIEDLEKRRKRLSKLAYSEGHESYTREYQRWEIQEFKDKLPELLKQIDKLEKELAELKADYKTKLDPLQSEQTFIEQAFITNTETNKNALVFRMKDEEYERMNLYDAQGRFILSRHLTDSEKQLVIKPNDEADFE